jgi:hypothetical protein
LPVVSGMLTLASCARQGSPLHAIVLRMAFALIIVVARTLHVPHR